MNKIFKIFLSLIALFITITGIANAEVINRGNPQSPWLANINAGGFSITNLLGITATNSTTTNATTTNLFVSGSAKFGSSGSVIWSWGPDSNNSNNYCISGGNDLSNCYTNLTTSGSFGIGTTSPHALLSVNGSPAGTINLLEIASSSPAWASSTVFKIDQNGKASFPYWSFNSVPYIQIGTNGGANGNMNAINISDGRSAILWDGGNSALSLQGAAGKGIQLTANTTIPTFSASPDFYISGGATGLGTAGSVGIGTTSPIATFQATIRAANSTTSIQFGKPSQNKGTCHTEYDTAGTPVYYFWPAGATTPTYTSTKPSGCQN